MKRVSIFRRAAAPAAIVLATTCAPPLAPVGGGATWATVRYGPERAAPAYEERAPAAKAALLARINEERRAAGLSPLAYDLLGAKVGDAFCLDSATRGAVGHWDTRGRAPYLRWAEASGVDYHSQNFASRSRTGSTFSESVERLLLEAHAGMMAERPPDDGHRRTVLNPDWTHVGIGCALVGAEFRMTEEYSRHVAEWVEVPAGPLPAGARAPFAMRLLPGWRVGAVEICWEAPPRPLTLRQIASRAAYRYPPAIRTLRPDPGDGMEWEDGARGDFKTSPDGRLSLVIPLDHGPGSYYVLAYVGRSLASRVFTPAVAARIEARGDAR